MLAHTYQTKHLVIAVIVLLLLSVFIIALLPPSEGPLSPAEKMQILETLSGTSAQRLPLPDRHIVLELVSAAERTTTFSKEEKLSILDSL